MLGSRSFKLSGVALAALGIGFGDFGDDELKPATLR
jgi:hypothetical protein